MDKESANVLKQNLAVEAVIDLTRQNTLEVRNWKQIVLGRFLLLLPYVLFIMDP